MRGCDVMKVRKIVKIMLIVFSPLIALFISFVFPVKFTLKDVPYNDERDFLVIWFNTNLNQWLLLGDKNEMNTIDTMGKDISVIIEGANPREEASMDLWLWGTLFIVYGEILSEEYIAENYDFNTDRELRVIRSTKWNILGEIRTRNSFRRLFSKRYLTVYDLRWFDYVRYYGDPYEWW